MTTNRAVPLRATPSGARHHLGLGHVPLGRWSRIRGNQVVPSTWQLTPNPAGMRFLPLDQAPTQSLGLPTPPALGLALSGVNLLVSVGNLALSAATYRAVQRLDAKMEAMALQLTGIQESLNRIESSLRSIDARTKRIEVGVAENNLREALKYILKTSLQGDYIDLVVLATAAGDVHRFMHSVGGGLLEKNLRLSSDVRNYLTGITRLLFNVRVFTASRFNMLAGADPLKVVRIDPKRDYLWADISDIAADALAIAGLEKTFIAARDSIMETAKEVDEALADEDDDDDASLQGDVGFDLDVIGSSIDRACDLLLAGTRFRTLMPESVLEMEDANEAAKAAEDLIRAWLWKTDGGLVWRAWRELSDLEDGYEFPWEHVPESRQMAETVTVTAEADLRE